MNDNDANERYAEMVRRAEAGEDLCDIAMTLLRGEELLQLVDGVLKVTSEDGFTFFRSRLRPKLR